MNNDKPCKLCENKRYANTSWCFKHFKEREIAKRKEKELKKKLRKESSQGYLKELKKKVHSKTWKLMSEWVRRKDANLDGMNECYTCNHWKHWKELQAGHFKHDKLDFDERNLKPQCPQCNSYKSGCLDVYAERLLKEYGLEWFNKLVRDAWAHQGYSIEEMKVIQEELKEKISNL